MVLILQELRQLEIQEHITRALICDHFSQGWDVKCCGVERKGRFLKSCLLSI